MSKVEIIKPTNFKRPDLITGQETLEFFGFDCVSCGEKLQLSYSDQIENSWTGKGKTLSDEEFAELKNFYHIGLANKSEEGGFPVFDKICCKECLAEYFTYVGIDEPRNSVYHIQVQGIIKQ